MWATWQFHESAVMSSSRELLFWAGWKLSARFPRSHRAIYREPVRAMARNPTTYVRINGARGNQIGLEGVDLEPLDGPLVGTLLAGHQAVLLVGPSNDLGGIPEGHRPVLQAANHNPVLASLVPGAPGQSVEPRAIGR